MALPTRVNRAAGSIQPYEAAQREFDSMLSRFFGGRDWEPGMMAPYGVDVREDRDHLYVEAELPGFRKDDVQITLENQTLNIFAERKEEHREGDEKKGDWLLHERRYDKYQRSFSLPNTVDEQKVDAKLNDGVLTITLDKREESKPRRIQVG
jgi:HSP20 family protein